ncbi:hypothetical protein N7453_000220 [Penicillium expansum]|nr:hypothetical protein N7453_000220 [Penicillium expansum]
MREDLNFPQDLLDRVNTAQHSPSRDFSAKYVFHVIHSEDFDIYALEEKDSEDEEKDSEDGDSERQHTFDTLEEANNAALALFRKDEEKLNEVVWEVNDDGEVSLRAQETEDGIIYEIYVSAERI